VNFDKRGRPDSSATAPAYDFVRPYGQDLRCAMIFAFSAQIREGKRCNAVAAVRASGHADCGQQQAYGVDGRQADTGDPGLSMRFHRQLREGGRP